jgi:hypothetical protein
MANPTWDIELNSLPDFDTAQTRIEFGGAGWALLRLLASSLFAVLILAAASGMSI